MKDNKQRFQRYMDDLNASIRKERVHINTNEMIKRIQSQKQQLSDKLNARSLAYARAEAEGDDDVLKANNGTGEVSPEKNLSLIFQGQTVSNDFLKNYRLKKKI